MNDSVSSQGLSEGGCSPGSNLLSSDYSRSLSTGASSGLCLRLRNSNDPRQNSATELFLLPLPFKKYDLGLCFRLASNWPNCLPSAGIGYRRALLLQPESF